MGGFDHTDTVLFPIYMTWLLINALASLLTLYLLKCSKRVNEYNTLIFWMTAAQFGFDFAHMFTADIYHHIERATSDFCGLATGLFSLVICALLCHIVVARNYIDVRHYIKKINLAIWIAVFYSSAYGSNQSFIVVYAVYNYTRISIIGIIIVMAVVTYHTIRQLRLDKTNNGTHPIFLLSKRLSLYPIVQIMSRVPVFIYQISWGTPYSQYKTIINPSINQTLWFEISSFTFPLGGVGNFIAFYFANPYCRSICIDLLHCKFTKVIKEPEDIFQVKESSRESLNAKMTLNEIFNNDNANTDRDSLSRDSLQLFDIRLTAEDFNYDYMYDEFGKLLEIDYTELDEEQLCRYIAGMNLDQKDYQ